MFSITTAIVQLSARPLERARRWAVWTAACLVYRQFTPHCILQSAKGSQIDTKFNSRCSSERFKPSHFQQDSPEAAANGPFNISERTSARRATHSPQVTTLHSPGFSLVAPSHDAVAAGCSRTRSLKPLPRVYEPPPRRAVLSPWPWPADALTDKWKDQRQRTAFIKNVRCMHCYCH